MTAPLTMTVDCPNCGRPIQVFTECVLDGPVVDGSVTVKIIPVWDHVCEAW